MEELTKPYTNQQVAINNNGVWHFGIIKYCKNSKIEVRVLPNISVVKIFKDGVTYYMPNFNEKTTMDKPISIMVNGTIHTYNHATRNYTKNNRGTYAICKAIIYVYDSNKIYYSK